MLPGDGKTTINFILQTENCVIVKDIAQGKEDRRFTYDFAMWSHDGFTVDEKGYNTPNPGSNYCD